MVTAEEFLEQAIITEAIKDRARVEAAQYRSPATVQPTVQQPVYAAPQPIYYAVPQQSGSGWTIAALCVAALAIVIAYATLTGYLGVTPLTATQLQPTVQAVQPTALVPTRAPAVVVAPQAPAAVQQPAAAPQPTIEQPAAPAPAEATPAPLVPIEPTPAAGINTRFHAGSDGISWGGSISNPAPDKEATVQAWLASPPSVPTATVIPTEQVPAFKASFQDAPPCNPLVGYVGNKARQCYH